MCGKETGFAFSPQDGKEEVAVKAVSKAYFKQDPKVRENLEREIRIMKHLRNCEYVVHLNHVQVRREGGREKGRGGRQGGREGGEE